MDTPVVEAATRAADATLRAASLTAGAAFVASVFALFAALVAAHVAKRNGRLQGRVVQQAKHAEFRQAWINDLRQKMVRFQALSYRRDLTGDLRTELESLGIHIVLMMNRADPDYKGLVNLLKSLPNSPPDDPSHAQYVTLCQDILKREWNTTKAELYVLPRGEIAVSPFPLPASSPLGD